MTLESILPQVQKLSNHEKLALIEATAQMLRKEQALKETAAPFSVESLAEQVLNGSPYPASDALVDASVEEVDAILQQHLTSPDPDADQMLQFGMFKGRIPVDEVYFRMAEWHPSDEDLANG